MRAWALVGVAALVVLPRAAAAHHVVSEAGIAWVEPARIAEVELTMSAFDLGASVRGNWQTLALRYEQPFLERFSIAGLVPVSHIDFDDGRRVIGLGDVELSAKAELVATSHGGLLWSAGVGTGLPTGVVADGLGAGHLEVAPFTALSVQPTTWLVLNAVAIHRESLGGGEHPSWQGSHGAVVAPHTDRESALRLEAAVTNGRVYGKLLGEGTRSWQEHAASSLRAGAELGFASPGLWRASLRYDMPVAGWRRNSGTLGVAFALMF
jgi:hypothetical protein